jgi:hypothetical protein
MSGAPRRTSEAVPPQTSSCVKRPDLGHMEVPSSRGQTLTKSCRNVAHFSLREDDFRPTTGSEHSLQWSSSESSSALYGCCCWRSCSPSAAQRVERTLRVSARPGRVRTRPQGLTQLVAPRRPRRARPPHGPAGLAASGCPREPLDSLSASRVSFPGTPAVRGCPCPARRGQRLPRLRRGGAVRGGRSAPVRRRHATAGTRRRRWRGPGSPARSSRTASPHPLRAARAPPRPGRRRAR